MKNLNFFCEIFHNLKVFHHLFTQIQKIHGRVSSFSSISQRKTSVKLKIFFSNFFTEKLEFINQCEVVATAQGQNPENPEKDPLENEK